MRQAHTVEDTISDGDLAVNMESFARHLRADNLSPRTQKTYLEAVSLMAEFLADQGMPQTVANISPEHVEAFIANVLERWRPATAANRYRSQQWRLQLAFSSWQRASGTPGGAGCG